MAKDNVSPLGSLEDISNACNELIKFNIDEKVRKTLHLVMKSKRRDMIASGIKKEEYREVTLYWAKRLFDTSLRQYLKRNDIVNWYITDKKYLGDLVSWFRLMIKQKDIVFRNFENVCFHLGYTNITMTLKINEIVIDRGRGYWGAEPNKYYFVIKLGERVEQ